MKGKTQKEHWKRVIFENGCYRLCKSENVKEFMKAEGLPEKMICMMDDFKIRTLLFFVKTKCSFT